MMRRPLQFIKPDPLVALHGAIFNCNLKKCLLTKLYYPSRMMVRFVVRYNEEGQPWFIPDVMKEAMGIPAWMFCRQTVIQRGLTNKKHGATRAMGISPQPTVHDKIAEQVETQLLDLASASVTSAFKAGQVAVRPVDDVPSDGYSLVLASHDIPQPFQSGTLFARFPFEASDVCKLPFLSSEEYEAVANSSHVLVVDLNRRRNWLEIRHDTYRLWLYRADRLG